MTDITEENPNIHYRESLTVWGMTMSAQMRGLAGLALYHSDNAPRSTENGQPYEMPTLDAILLRDLLNAATERGDLPKPATPAQKKMPDPPHHPGTLHTVTELEGGEHIAVGVNGDSARVIGGTSIKMDDGSYEEWLTLSVPRTALFRLERPPT